MKRFLHLSLSLVLAFSLLGAPFALVGNAQGGGTATASSADKYSAALAAIEAKVEARRAELGIPGMSLAIIKDGQVIYLKGLGYKDFEKKVPVTPDTQFAIGSSTKAFTALTVLMAHDEGKLSLDASPRTVMPYFKMADPETDKNITIRDLLTHSSGLNRTDIAMISGRLTRQELIRVAGEAKPVAKLREQFGYQNLMYTAAGEVVAVVEKKPWEKVVPEKIFKPLGMTNSVMSISEMEKAKDYSFGYSYNFDTKETERLPFRALEQVAPAGSINSSARDMAKWIKFVLAGGTVDGKRLVSGESFAEWLKPQMKVNPNGTVNYGLGWFIRQWNGKTVVEHGGNIDGFNALVAMIPEENLGFVMLTNVTGSTLGNELMPIVWENILGKPKAPDGPVAAPGNEVGRYRFQQAGFDIEVKMQDGKLVALAPNQPTYVLENTRPGRFRMTGAPDGFFITFRDNEIYLEQPHGNYTLPRVKGDGPVSQGRAKELIGRYSAPQGSVIVEIKEHEGKVSFVLPGQPPYALTPKGEGEQYALTPLPDTYTMRAKRSVDGTLEAVVVSQPEGEFTFKVLTASAIEMTVDELMGKHIAAIGGEDNLRKLTSRVATAEIDLEQQGIKATATMYAKAPNLSASELTLTALGKAIATGYEFFDGKAGEQLYSFSPVSRYSGKRLEDARLSSDFYGPLNWRQNYDKIEIIRTVKCGEEDCYAVEFEPENGTKFIEFYSAKTFLLIRREGVIPSSTSSTSLPYSVRYEDYREVDGVIVPFKTTNNTAGNGNVVTTIKSVKHNVPVNDNVFKPRKLK
ncbi:MAG: serine hydrolase [Blastocatellia bacterium]|nr:serine hydrolase [Blastocatellia bacterium]